MKTPLILAPALVIGLALSLNSCSTAPSNSSVSASPSTETSYRKAIYTSGSGTYTNDIYKLGSVQYTNKSKDVFSYLAHHGTFTKHPSGKTITYLINTPNANYDQVIKESYIKKPISQSQLPRGRFPIVSKTPIIGSHLFNGRLDTVYVSIIATHFRIRADKKVELAVREILRFTGSYKQIPVLSKTVQVITPDYLGTFEGIRNIAYLAEIDKTIITHEAAGPGELDMSALNFDDMNTVAVVTDTAGNTSKPTSTTSKPAPKKVKSGIRHGVNGWKLMKYGNIKMLPVEQRIKCAG